MDVNATALEIVDIAKKLSDSKLAMVSVILYSLSGLILDNKEEEIKELGEHAADISMRMISEQDRIMELKNFN